MDQYHGLVAWSCFGRQLCSVDDSGNRDCLVSQLYSTALATIPDICWTHLAGSRHQRVRIGFLTTLQQDDICVGRGDPHVYDDHIVRRRPQQPRLGVLDLFRPHQQYRLV